jgi:hypothetical protein
VSCPADEAGEGAEPRKLAQVRYEWPSRPAIDLADLIVDLVVGQRQDQVVAARCLLTLRITVALMSSPVARDGIVVELARNTVGRAHDELGVAEKLDRAALHKDDVVDIGQAGDCTGKLAFMRAKEEGARTIARCENDCLAAQKPVRTEQCCPDVRFGAGVDSTQDVVEQYQVPLARTIDGSSQRLCRSSLLV